MRHESFPTQNNTEEQSEPSRERRGVDSGSRSRKGLGTAAAIGAATLAGTSPEAQSAEPNRTNKTEMHKERINEADAHSQSKEFFTYEGSFDTASNDESTSENAGTKTNTNESNDDEAFRLQEERRVRKIVEDGKLAIERKLDELPAVTMFGGVSQSKVVGEMKKNNTELKQFLENPVNGLPEASEELQDIMKIYQDVLAEVKEINQEKYVEALQEAQDFMEYINAHSKMKLLAVSDKQQHFQEWRAR